jgi:hypothetical protein
MAKDENGKVFFDADEQKELDRVVEERLARDRAKSQSETAEYREALEELKELGYEGTPAQVRDKLRQTKAQAKAQKELQDAEARALQNGTSPELEKELIALRKKVEDQDQFISSKKTEEQKAREQAEAAKDQDRRWEENVKEFETAYPDITVDDLAKNKRFVEFADGKKGSLKSVYERFLEFSGDDEKTRKARDKDFRSTGGGSGSTGRDYGLTASQKATLAEWNKRNPHAKMTEKEYAERL